MSGLPPLLVLTERFMSQDAGLGLLATLTEAAAGGARAVVLREKDLPWRERTAMAREILSVLHPFGGELVVASDAVLADEVGAGWVHLADADAVPPAGLRWGRSCHTAVDVLRAADEGASYVTVSPVFATLSKPGYGPPVGIDGIAEAVALLAARAGSPVDVYGLGGIGPAEAARCVEAGAAGVAVMGEIMRSADPSAAVQALLDSL